MSYKIFANHAHVFPKKIKESGSLDALKALMEECEIEKAVTFATFHNFFNGDADSDRTNELLYNDIKNDSRFVGFGVIDFTKENLKEQVEQIYQFGFKGIKIHPAAQKIKVDGKQAFEVYERAEELGLFISFHTGLHWHRISDYNVILFDEVAYNFKNLCFSMEHVGGYSQFLEALLVMCNNKRNGNTVYAGWTSIDNSEGNGTWSLSDQQLLDLIYQTGEERSIFGLDFPYNNAESTKRDIERIKNLNITDTAKAAILGGNLSRALNVEL